MRHVETTHTEKTEHICNICEKQFTRKDVLQKHQKIVHQIEKRRVTLPGINDGDRFFDCHICEKIFKEKFVLNRHLETVHNDNCAKYQCNECEKQFKRKDHLQKHIKTHIKIICETCLKQFKSKDGLKAHRIGSTNLVKFHLMPEPRRPPSCSFNHVHTGAAFFPFTSTFANMSNVAPCDAANALISDALPGSWAPNWLHGKARIANLPASPPYCLYRVSS